MENSHSDESAMFGINQLIPPDEIKQEPDIKEEPISDDELVEFPAIFDGAIGQPFCDPVRYYGGGGDIGNLPLNEVKSKVKPACAGKKQKTSNVHGKNDGKMGKRQKQHSTGHAVRKASKSGKLKSQGNSSRQHQCSQCGYNAKYKSLLESHLQIHTGEKPFACSHCPKEFRQKVNLQRHMKMHVDEYHFHCAVCLQGFDGKDVKMEHEKECRIRRYECHLCKQLFGSNKTHLIRHIRIHSGTKPFQCKECLKQFTRKCNLISHMKTHAGSPLFYCSRCRNGFVQKVEMVAHEQKCSRRLYECYVCGKFIGMDKGNLVRHMRTHTGNKPFPCMMCPRKFASKLNQTVHMNRIHNKTR